jgi:acetyl esterase/lipase
MKTFTLDLTNENVTLTAYLPDTSPEMPNMDSRRAILVIPGGGYHFCSDREAEPIALKFLAKGYAAFILRYSLNENSEFPKPLNDAEEALALIRKNAGEWGVNPRKIAAIGFSAGGHLTAMLSVAGKERPNAQILGYACTLEKIGKILAKPIPGADVLVDDKTPPAFIFASAEDNVVPIENSLKYAEALDSKDIPFEMHIFQKGYHGFSTAEEYVYAEDEHRAYNADCAVWVPLCLRWLDNLFGKYA